MQIFTPENIVENYLKWWDGHARQTGQLHNRFLEMRQAGLHHLAGSIEQQLESFRRTDPGVIARTAL